MQLDDKGLTPAICQHDVTGEVIMLGYVNPGALKRTLEGGDVWFYSRSRADMWHKGEVSGNYMRIKSATMDCDGDTLLLKVIPDGPICHTGNPTCFFTPFDELPEFERADKGSGILEELFSVIQDRKEAMPEGSYTTQLFNEGPARIAQKVIEEAGEVAIAGATGDRDQTVREMSDLLYHSLVLLSALGAKPEDVWQELRDRRGSGIRSM
ncbi:MAG: bifunctional phosphoribosyl-AMP cyclohydrolase/phosphoribosyl-ATP diphosphatase HisIE [Chloroflexi bacterium]|nr:bifunctional phosphoribosyl-AMP cyclohydrolase/phosphoribosyl-ATP diphosphatase HisIE [Chloroflexota bacterium]